jgi:branched-chain amino acid transport system ATP-binding protein/nonpolar-amino-acid-transporting ATPase
LFGDLTVRQNLALARRNAADGRTRFFHYDELLEMFPVVRQKIDTTVSLLSGGQQQMVAIARALLLQPRVLVLDEPSTGLSPRAVSDVLGALQVLRARGTGVILVEQSLAIAAQATDRGYVMSLGRMVREVARNGWAEFMADPEAVNAYLGG